MQILVGCDPEVFVKKGRSFHSAHGLIPGTKESPFKVDKGAVQVDGMALEFNTDPAATEDEFNNNIVTVMDQLKAMVPGYDIVVSPTAVFPEKHFENTPEVAKELGCDPDFDAWNEGAPFEKPDNKTRMRTASGHVHIGWTSGADIKDPEHLKDCMDLVRQLDYFLGLPSLLFDKDKKRRTMYGKAGCFRPKSYGVEYRTLSNHWIQHEGLRRWVFQNVQAAVAAMGDRFMPTKAAHWYTNHTMINKKRYDMYDMEDLTYYLKDARIPLPPVELCGGKYY